MWGKIWGFFKGFLGNVKSDPVSTVKGLVQVAAGGATAYGMATGVVPVNGMSIGFASAAVTSGIHSMGTDSTGNISATAIKLENAVQVATAMAPMTLSVVDQIAELKKEAEEGQKKIEAYQQVTNAVFPLLPK